MYPFRDDNIYVRNTWYVAALRDEISRTPMERIICDEPIVLYRTEAGDPVAMYGLCPHRYYPLALGKLDGDAIICGYHGFTFDCSGKCIRIPAQQDKGAGFSQRTYPVVDHGPWTWIWPGDAALADPAELPDLDFLGFQKSGEPSPGHAAFVDICKPFAGRSQLIVDNLMDLTHFAFLHHAQIDSTALVRWPIRTQPFGKNGMSAIREIKGGTWDGFCEFSYLAPNRFETADWRSETLFYSPGLLITWSFEFTSVDGKTEIPPALGLIRFIHAITPATKTSSYYFQANTRNFRIDDAQFHAINGQISSRIVDEDIAAAEAMEPRVDHASTVQRELMARSDVAGVKVRELVQRLIDEETGVGVAVAAE